MEPDNPSEFPRRFDEAADAGPDGLNQSQSPAIAGDREQLQATASDGAQPHAIAEEEEMPADDEYVFTIKSAAAYATTKGAYIPERTIYDNCQHGRERGTLHCWKSGFAGSQLLVGKRSLDSFIQKRLERDAFRERVDLQDESAAQSERHEEEEKSAQYRHGDGDSKKSSKELIEARTRIQVLEVDVKVKERLLEELNASREGDINRIESLAEALGEKKQYIHQLEEQLRLPPPSTERADESRPDEMERNANQHERSHSDDEFGYRDDNRQPRGERGNDNHSVG